MPGLLAASDVLGTGWFAAVSAEVGPGKTVAVVGDGAVGLLGVLAARHLGAERIIAVSRHADRQRLATTYGATDIVTERGDAGVAAVKELTDGLGAHSVIEAVGTQESMMQAIRSTRPGGHVGYVGVSHDVSLPGDELFFSAVHLAGGPAPVRRFLPELIDLIMSGEIDPGLVFDLERALRGGGRGLPRHGRAARDQVAAPPLMVRTAFPAHRVAHDGGRAPAGRLPAAARHRASLPPEPTPAPHTEGPVTPMSSDPPSGPRRPETLPTPISLMPAPTDARR